MTFAATVFGLDVHAEQSLAVLAGARARPTGRQLELALASDPDAEPPWPRAARVVCDQRERDGSVNFQIEADRRAGYLIWGPTYGAHLIDAVGRRALCMPRGVAEAGWQRLLVAQVLPFVAVLRGLEVLHASAVARAGGAIAILGPSGAGKTSVALELCRRGAEFLADDVLALERTGADELLCHPGTPAAGLSHAEAERLEYAGIEGHETVAVNERERLVRVRGAAQPAPLRAVYVLERDTAGPDGPRFEPLTGGVPLIGATFNSVVTPPKRLHGLLEICARAARQRVERVVIGPRTDAAQLAEAMLERLDGRS